MCLYDGYAQLKIDFVEEYLYLYLKVCPVLGGLLSREVLEENRDFVKTVFKQTPGSSANTFNEE